MHTLLVPLANAQNTMDVNTLGLTPESVIRSVIDTLAMTIFSVAAAAFLLGALMYAAGFINEENKSKGKSLMIGSIIGMAVVLASQAIFNTMYFFVYG